MSARAVQRAVIAVLDGEGVGAATVSVTFLPPAAMRGLNRRALARDRATDVIAFGLPHPDRSVSDVYVCPAAARPPAGGAVALREEILRLVVHGVLHALGYDHPKHAERTTSPMWRKQEGYVRGLRKRGR